MISEWRKIALWFDTLKISCGAEHVPDAFVIKHRTVFLRGDSLESFMSTFWEREGQGLSDFAIDEINRRLRLKSHLMEFIASIDSGKLVNY